MLQFQYLLQSLDFLSFDIFHPDKWSFAKISVINSRDGSEQVITTTPDKKASIDVYENAEYWIDAKIRVNGNTSNAFDVVQVSSLNGNQSIISMIDIPKKQIGIISVIVIGIAVFGWIKRK